MTTTTPTPAPAPMTASDLISDLNELVDYYETRADIDDNDLPNFAMRAKWKIEASVAHIDALTARVSRLLEAVEGAEKALEFIAAHKGKTLISTEHGEGYSHGANAGFEQLASAAEDALATLRAAREVKP